MSIGRWKCGICDTENEAWVRLCSCKASDGLSERKVPCTHEQVSLSLSRNAAWCSLCDQRFDIVWRGRGEETNELLGVELLKAEDEVHT